MRSALQQLDTPVQLCAEMATRILKELCYVIKKLETSEYPPPMEQGRVLASQRPTKGMDEDSRHAGRSCRNSTEKTNPLEKVLAVGLWLTSQKQEVENFFYAQLGET
jgi:hypothetical protein